jgi:hypothetical protein
MTGSTAPAAPSAAVGRQQLIDLANEEMRVAKLEALAAYERVCPRPMHARCTERCRDAHRELLEAFADANAAYSAAIPRI